MNEKTPGQPGTEVAHDPEIPVRLVQLYLCDLCLDGAGGECHVPGCALWINRAPDIAIRDSAFVTILDEEPIDQLHDLIRDMLQSFPDTADEQEWRDRAGALSVCDPDGQPYRAYTEDDL